MRIGFISQWYAPENVWVPTAIVDGLRAEGHDVVVVTGTPHYPTGAVADGYSATQWRTETIDGVRVHRVPEFPYRGSGLLGRLLGYASFAVTASWRALAELRDREVILVYGSPATAALPAMVLRALTRIPYVLQVQDVWPDSVVDSGFVRRSLTLRAISTILHAFVSASYAGAARIVAITPSAVTLIGGRPGARGKVELVHNWTPDPAVAEAAQTRGLRARIGADPDAPVFLYAGAMGAPQNLGAVVDAFVAADLDAHLVLIGTGTHRQALLERSAAADRVHILPAVPLPEATALTREADVALVSLADTALHRATFPSKIQFLCGLGMPLLVAAPGDAATYVTDNGAGLAADPADRGSITAAFRWFAALGREDRCILGQAARRCYDADFAPSVGAGALSRILQHAADPETAVAASLHVQSKDR